MFSKKIRGRAILALLALSLGGVLAAQAQNAPGAARQAAEERRAVFKLIGANFRPLGALLKEGGQYDAADVKKRIAREIFLAGLLPEAFPDISNVGEPDSKARPEIWTNRAEFDQALKKFQTDLATLQEVNDKEQSFSEPFKTALGAVAQNCKSCHDNFKLK